MNRKDFDWIRERQGNRGSSYRASTDDGYPCKIGYIYGKSSMHIFYLNVILYLRWLKRRARRWFKLNVVRR